MRPIADKSERFRSISCESGSYFTRCVNAFFQADVFLQWVEGYPIILFLMILGFATHYFPEKWELKMQQFIAWLPLIGKAILIALVIWLVAQFKSADIQPFIYFQF